MEKLRIRHFLILAAILIGLSLLTLKRETVYTVESEVTLYRNLHDGGLLTKKMENEEGKRYILIRDKESMEPEYISEDEYKRLVAANPLTVSNGTQNNTIEEQPIQPPRD